MKISANKSSPTLLAFLRDHLVDYPSVKAIKRAINAGLCTINRKIETFSTHPIQKGDEIEIHLENDRTKSSLEILWEDEDLIIYDKPAGVSSEKLSKHLLVHRLDKQTSGVIVFAKNQEMQNALTDLFRHRKVDKTYLAVCDGKVEKSKWSVDNCLEKKAAYQGGALYGKGKTGKRAITKFRLLKSQNGISLIEARPITGRTHQIRVHLKEEGYPVLGDYQYCQSFQCDLRPKRLLLHSQEIAFTHPFTKKQIICRAPLPSELEIIHSIC